jgi:hypothetical protein
MLIYDVDINFAMSTEQLEPAVEYYYEAREVAMKELEKHLTEMADLVGYDAVGQAMINAFGYHLDTDKDNIADANLFLLCAVKELMISKDPKSIFSGSGYIWEKVSKAMDRLDMPIKPKNKPNERLAPQ